MLPPQLKMVSVRKLRGHLLARRFAVPKLQRNFVWDAGRAAKLLDSMFHDMPIGSLFLWEMDAKSANLIRQSAEVLPSFDGRNRQIWFVIDGQQRLSVIYQAFEAQTRANDAGRSIDFSRLCFVVTPDSDQDTPRRIVYRKPLGREFVSVSDILKPDWKQRMPSQAKGFLATIRICRDRLLSYPVPVVTVHSATLEEIGEVFVRVNSQGMRITSADRAIALMGKLDMRAMAQELRQKVRDGGFALPGVDPILMGFNLVTERPGADGDPPKLDVMARAWARRLDRDDAEKDQFRKLWHRYQNAFLVAVEYIRNRFPVHDESYLPSANMLATLAVFFFHHPGQPDGYQAGEIRKWFWATGVANRYTGRGYHRNLSADARLFTALASGLKRRFEFRDYLDPAFDIQRSEYGARSATARTFFCLLASRNPKYLDNGEAIPIGYKAMSHANAKNRHHIFPKAQLQGHFKSSEYNGLSNICFLVARDNQLIGMQVPRHYLSSYKESGTQQFARVMRSHLIPAGQDCGVWQKGIVRAFKQFQKERLALICSEFERQAGIRLFKKA